MSDERILTIGLNTLPGMRACAAAATFERFRTAAAILAAPAEALTAVRGVGPALAGAVRSLDAAKAGEAEERRARECGVSILTLGDAAYPARLRMIPDPPRVLYVRGTLAPGDDDGIAVVGARAASAYGRTVAGRLAHDLAA
ncbi:MAG TPA: DNA-processing protein DprA, partial [bacterium]